MILKRKSLQLGNAKLISKKFNKPVVDDFRKSDILLGGEGAPLVPIFHRAVFSKKKNVLVINIGEYQILHFKMVKKNFCL